MSRSPERISSYRRHFEDASTSSFQVRVSSPSPVRRDAGRCRSASYTRSAVGSSMAVGRRTISSSRSRPFMTGSEMRTICVRGGGPAVDLDQAAAENREFLSTRTSEKQEMVLLNDRLAVYIEKVRSLEQQNKLLETEIEALQNRFLKPTGLRLLYEEQLKELKRLADQMKIQRDLAVAAKDAASGQLEMIKVKYEEAVEMRKKAEMNIEAFRPDVDAATSTRIALEKQLENLEVELEFLHRVHKEEIEELMKQIYSAHATAVDAFSLPDLSHALQQIQHQYDDIAAKNLQEMDSWYKTKFEDLNNKSTKHVDRARGIREEIVSAKKDIQNKERDMESLKARGEGLEAQIRETQEKYRKEIEALQARIEALQLELKSTKERIALLLREYQDLLNVKMGLEIEITTYRKLIEGEDSRLTAMVQGMHTMSLMSGSVSVHRAGATSIKGAMGAGLGVGISVGVGGGLGDAVGRGIGDGVGRGLSDGVGRDLVDGVGKGLSDGAGRGLSDSVGRGLIDGAGKGMSDAAGKGLSDAAGKGLSDGVGKGLSDGTGKVLDGFTGGLGTSADYIQEQAVEMTERKTVLIRTVKTEDDTLESSTQEKSYSISGAADEEE